jgi:hypothetical protein
MNAESARALRQEYRNSSKPSQTNHAAKRMAPQLVFAALRVLPTRSARNASRQQSEGRFLSASERNLDIRDMTSRRSKRDRLPVALRGHVQQCRERLSLNSSVYMIAVDSTAELTRRMLRRLAPIASQVATAEHGTTAEVDVIAVAGAA